MDLVIEFNQNIFFPSTQEEKEALVNQVLTLKARPSYDDSLERKGYL